MVKYIMSTISLLQNYSLISNICMKSINAGCSIWQNKISSKTIVIEFLISLVFVEF